MSDDPKVSVRVLAGMEARLDVAIEALESAHDLGESVAFADNPLQLELARIKGRAERALSEVRARLTNLGATPIR